MKNMGLSSLVLVAPPTGLDAPEVRALAYGAWDVLDGARTAPDLAAAVAEATFVVGTSGKSPTGALTPRQLAQTWRSHAGGGRMAIAFGPEASGLAAAELDLCHALVTIPSDAAQPSLNLAQAVLVVAYEIFAAGASAVPEAQSERATTGETERALSDLREALLAIGFLNPQNPEAILAEMRRLVARAALTSREATWLRGLARQIRWASRKP